MDATTPKLVPDLIRDSKMRTPLLVACAAGNADVVKVLMEYGADPNCLTGDIVGNKPLDLAVISNSVDTVIALLDAGTIPPPTRYVYIYLQRLTWIVCRSQGFTKTTLGCGWNTSIQRTKTYHEDTTASSSIKVRYAHQT